MNRIVRTARALALASLVALLATAVAQGMNHGAGHAHGSTTPPGAAGAPMGMGPMGMGPMGMGPMAMGMGMDMPMATQTVDEASFLVHMIPHHREAVASAEALRAVTRRPELLALADAIVTSQTAEIEAMEGWLDAWHPDALRDVDYAPMMRDLGPDADVADIERAFLEDMIGHHMMAVHEARTLLAAGLAEHDEVAALARSIVADQMGEMHQMAAWLGTWFGVGAPMGMGMGLPGIGAMGMPGSAGMGMPGMGTHDVGMGAAGGMHGWAGRHGATHGMGGRHGATHGAMHGSMRSGATLAPAAVRPDEVDRLVRAFLSGQGVDASAAILEAPTLAYEVTVRVDGATQVLRVDAATGTVMIVPAR